jgi:hypothetical protein
VRRALGVAAAALALAALPSGPARAQAAGAFTGNYRLSLTFGSSCSATVRSVAVFFVLGEQSVTSGTEIDGRPAIADETTAAEVTLHHVGSAVHGPLATIGSRSEREPITTVEGYLTGLWLVLDGTVTTGTGRPSAKGTAAGFLEAGRATDDSPDTLGACTAANHSWTLDPV